MKYFLILILIITNLKLYSAPGDLDLTFDGDGIFTINNFTNNLYFELELTADNKIVAGGYYGNAGNNFFSSIIRVNSNGTYDNTFDADGITSTDIVGGTQAEYGYSLSVNQDGNYYLAGYYDNGNPPHDSYLINLNSSGALDNTFDGDGIALLNLGNICNFYDVIQLSDGKVLSVGRTNVNGDEDVVVVRYNSDGSLDNTFDTDGILIIDIGGNERANSVIELSNGQYLLGGFSDVAGDGDVIVMRINSDASLDNTFDTDGIYSYVEAGFQEVKEVNQLSDGNYLLTGNNVNDGRIIKITDQGSLDISFNSTGIFNFDGGNGIDEFYSSVEQEDGKIITTGDTDNGVNRDIMLVRLNSNGTIDNTFDTDGIKGIGFSGEDFTATDIKINSNGEVFVIGNDNTIPHNSYIVKVLLATQPSISSSPSISSLTSNSIALSVNIDFDEYSTISNRGIVYSLSSNPTLSDNVIQSGTGDGTFQVSISNLSPGVNYYVRSYAVNSEGTTYGPELAFTTPDIVDNDADGVDNTIESSAPNSGDGNNDGLQDSQQANVASLRGISGSYITVQLVSCDSLLNVENFLRTENDNFEFPFGVISFSAPCSEAIVKIFYHNVNDLSLYSYRKETASGRWIEYEDSEFSIETIDGEQVAVATLTLSDGGIGDSDGIVNGMIVDPGGPAIPITANIPIWDWWWVLVIIPIIIYSYRRLT